MKWFGYKLHLIVDATHELPIYYHVTKASASDITEAHKMLDTIEEKCPEILHDAEVFMGDKAYDDTKMIKDCQNHNVKTVIDIRDM